MHRQYMAWLCNEREGIYSHVWRDSAGLPTTYRGNLSACGPDRHPHSWTSTIHLRPVPLQRYAESLMCTRVREREFCRSCNKVCVLSCRQFSCVFASAGTTPSMSCSNLPERMLLSLVDGGPMSAHFRFTRESCSATTCDWYLPDLRQLAVRPKESGPAGPVRRIDVTTRLSGFRLCLGTAALPVEPIASAGPA
jgi:hypothetical protein